jgi:small subunit ribosomal protein S20
MRSNERRRLRNRVHIGRARSEVRRAREAIAAGDPAAANEAVRVATQWLDHAATKGSIHPNNAARRKSRLMAQLARMEPRAVEVAAVEEPPAKATRASKAAKSKSDKVEKVDKKVKAEKPTKAEKPAKKDKPAKAEKAVKAEKPAKEEKTPRSKTKKTTKKE